jgi:hypothetical protein
MSRRLYAGGWLSKSSWLAINLVRLLCASRRGWAYFAATAWSAVNRQTPTRLPGGSSPSPSPLALDIGRCFCSVWQRAIGLASAAQPAAMDHFQVSIHWGMAVRIPVLFCLMALTVFSSLCCKRTSEKSKDYGAVGSAGSQKKDAADSSKQSIDQPKQVEDPDAGVGKEPPVVVEPVGVPEDKGANKWQGRVKVQGDPVFFVSATVDVWQDGKVTDSFPLTTSLFSMNAGEIAVSVEAKEAAGKSRLEVTGECSGAFNSKYVVPLPMPEGPIHAPLHLKEKIETKDGRFAVWALTAGKSSEAKPKETLEESAKRSEWALMVMVKVERRQDTHRVSLYRKTEQSYIAVPTFLFVGPSFKSALQDWKNISKYTAQELAKRVTVDPKDPKLGTMQFMIRITKPSEPALGVGVAIETLTLERPDANSEAWALTAQAREKIKKLVGVR